jgi:carbonic anhydrase
MSHSKNTVLDRLLTNKARLAEEFEFAEPGSFENLSRGQTPQVRILSCHTRISFRQFTILFIGSVDRLR